MSFHEQEAISKAGIKDGQEFTYDPVYVDIKLEKSSALAEAVSLCFPPKIVGAYERVKFRWMKPDGKGGLVQRSK